MVYIILINYNGWKNTIECINSIFNNKYNNYKIIIVDNASRKDLFYEALFKNKFKDSVQELFVNDDFTNNKDSKEIVLIKNTINNGFAAGCNIAFKYVRKQGNIEYVWLLGNDNVIDRNALINLVNYMKQNNKIDLCGSVSIDYFNHNKIQCYGVGIYNKWFSSSKHLFAGVDIKKVEKNDIEYFKNKVMYVYGNSMFLSKRFFECFYDIPEEYFIYFEELEIMQQLKKLNMNFGIAKDSFIYHKEGASTGGKAKCTSLLADYYSIRNRILFTKKYYWYCLPTVYLGLIVAILNRIKRKQFERIPMIIKLMFNPYPKLNEVKE